MKTLAMLGCGKFFESKEHHYLPSPFGPDPQNRKHRAKSPPFPSPRQQKFSRCENRRTDFHKLHRNDSSGTLCRRSSPKIRPFPTSRPLHQRPRDRGRPRSRCRPAVLSAPIPLFHSPRSTGLWRGARGQSRRLIPGRRVRERC